MASNHVGDLYSGIGRQPSKGMGFGLTVDVVLDSVAAGRRASNGSFGWDGAFGTHFWVDRKEAARRRADDSGAGQLAAHRLRERGDAGDRRIALELHFLQARVPGPGE